MAARCLTARCDTAWHQLTWCQWWPTCSTWENILHIVQITGLELQPQYITQHHQWHGDSGSVDMRGTARVRADCVVCSAQWAMECDIYPSIAPVSTVTIGAGLAPPLASTPAVVWIPIITRHTGDPRSQIWCAASHGRTSWLSDSFRGKR